MEVVRQTGDIKLVTSKLVNSKAVEELAGLVSDMLEGDTYLYARHIKAVRIKLEKLRQTKEM